MHNEVKQYAWIIWYYDGQNRNIFNIHVYLTLAVEISLCHSLNNKTLIDSEMAR